MFWRFHIENHYFGNQRHIFYINKCVCDHLLSGESKPLCLQTSLDKVWPGEGLREGGMRNLDLYLGDLYLEEKRVG